VDPPQEDENRDQEKNGDHHAAEKEVPPWREISGHGAAMAFAGFFR